MSQLRVKYDEEAFKVLQRYDSVPATEFVQNDLGLKDIPFLREIVLNQLETMLCVEIENIGTVNLLNNYEDFKELLQFLQVQDQTQVWHIEGGNHRLPEKMFEKVLQNGGQIRFNHEVIKIDNSNHQKEIVVHAKVDHKNSSEVVKIKAKHIMFGLPQMIAKDIEIVKLSNAKRELFNSLLSSQASKSFLFLSKQVESFWKSGGIYQDTKSLTNIVVDISPQNTTQLGIYLFFHSKRRIPQFHKLSQTQRKQYLINNLIKGFQLDKEEDEYYEEESSESESNSQDKVKGKDEENDDDEEQNTIQIDEQLKKAFKESVHVEFNVGDNKFLKNAYSTLYGLNFYTKIIESGATLGDLDNEQYGISFISSEFSRTSNGYMEGAVQNSKLNVFRKIKEDYTKKLKKNKHLVEAKRSFY